MASDPRAAPDALLDYRSAGAALGVCPKQVYLLVQRGELKALRIGRLVRIDPRDLRAYIDRLRAAAGAKVARLAGEGEGRLA